MKLPAHELERMRQGLQRLGLDSYAEYLDSPGWHRRRRAAFGRANGSCFVCDRGSKLTVHHLSYLNLGRETSKDLVVLCEGCHNDVHELAFTKRVDLAVAHRSLAWKRSGKTDGMRVVQLPPGVRNRPGKGRKPRWAKPGPTLNLGPRKRSLKEVEEENRRLEIFQKIAKKNREVRHR